MKSPYIIKYKISPLVLPIFLLTLLFMIGALTFNDYGKSWDENSLVRYTKGTIGIYFSLFNPNTKPLYYDAILNFYGPSFLLITNFAVGVVKNFFPSEPVDSLWHLSYFVSFLIGVAGFYFLSRRWFVEKTSLLVTLLFATQPLLWGHAFINPKDIPFMSFFILSIYFGLKYLDSVEIKAYQTISAKIAASIKSPALIFAALILGLTSSVRVLGPFAGVLVALVLLYRQRGRGFISLIIYFLFAGIVCYLTWPYLWNSPIKHFYQSLRAMSDFPWDSSVLFQGKLFPADKLPVQYIPLLFAIQFTEPAVVLEVLALGVFFWKLIKKEINPEFALLVSLWGLIPLTAFIVFRPVMYDNFRQLFFLLPPLFLIIGFALEKFFIKATRWYIQAALGLILLLPGIVSIIHLHPYEYIYYNQFVGGVGGAFRNYELDYWETSTKESFEYLNQIARPNANIFVYGPENGKSSFVRKDLKINSANNKGATFDFAVLSSRWNKSQILFPDAPVIFTVERDGAILSVIKDLKP